MHTIDTYLKGKWWDFQNLTKIILFLYYVAYIE
jgi:hypothetical protein